MKANILPSGFSPEIGERISMQEKGRPSSVRGRAEFSEVLETMLRELRALTEEERAMKAKQDLPNFIQAVEQADQKFHTAMLFRRALLEAYQEAVHQSRK